MPSASHPQAKFDPIPPDLDLNALVESTPNFDYVPRISVTQIKDLGIDEFERVVLHHVIIGGKPLVVDGWEADLPPWLFSTTWLIDNVGTKPENVRDIGQSTNMPMTIGHYVKSMPQLTKNMTPKNFRDPKRQRLYLKDIDCPDAWYDKLEELIPPQLFYYNQTVGEKGGLGAVRERNSFGQMILGKGAAPAGDLMSSLPPEFRAENFMCYIGHEGTYTSAHREMCASLGQNIMVETSESDAGEVPGSSIWFMTESKDREVVSEFFLSMLGHDIEIETHFAQINAWKKAPFPVYIVEQKVGDFILIPPLAPHQVWNRGTRTMKAAWNRTTVDTLELAINEALPRARLVCRDEQYKNKAIIYYTLQKYSDLLDRVEAQGGQIQYNEYGQRASNHAGRVKQLQRDFRRLFDLFTTVMITEMFDPTRPERKVEFLRYDSNVTCSYCRCNIFNRFLTCKSCIISSDDGEIEDTYDVCLECYAMGRSCACISNLSWVEQWKWAELTSNYEKWRARVISILTSQSVDRTLDPETSPQPLSIIRKRLGKTPVAQICQEQLKVRPFRDPSKPYIPEPLPGDSDDEPEADDEGNLIKKKMTKRKSNQRKKTHHACHICRKAEENWKLSFCSDCSRAYCYGVLYRAFDLMPQTVMEQAEWKCPKCLKICSCAACRRDPRQKPYQPKGTLLGHDTKKVADYRSVEILVDFSRTNLGWLRGEGDDDPQSSQRMRKLVSKAIEEKTRGDDMEDAIGEDDPQYSNGTGALIDPRLGGGTVAPVAPMYANAYEEAGLLQNSQASPEYDRYGINEHPEHDDNFQPMYPEPPELGGRDRAMGAGYYHQQPGPEAILYNDPETGSLGEQNSSDMMDYPKLSAKEPEIVYNKTKRKRQSLAKSTPRAADDAHSEYIQAQKKQKLADARANDKFYMTQNQLEGGDPLIVSFAVPKEFLDNLKTPSTKKARPTRASLRAEAAEAEAEEDEDTKMVDSPNLVRSDVQPTVINSDDEFDLALQAMNNFKSTMNAETSRKTNGVAKRGAKKTRGARGGNGVAKPSTQIPRRRQSSSEVDLQILNETTHEARDRSMESSIPPSNVAEIGPSTSKRRGPKPSTQRYEDVEDDFTPSVSVGRTTRQQCHAKSSDEEESDRDEPMEKFSNRRPVAGKKHGLAPKFTQAEVDDNDDEYISISAQGTARPTTRTTARLTPKSGVQDQSDSEEVLEVAQTLSKKRGRRGRPPRETKSLGGGMLAVDKPISKPSNYGGPDRRRSAPIAKMVADKEEEEEQDEEEIPETQYTNSFTPLNQREIGRRLRSARDSPASFSHRSVRFEETPDDDQRLDSPPRRFATFEDADSHSSPEPIDYSIFEDGTALVDRDDDVNGAIFPRGRQRVDQDDDMEMDQQQNSVPVAIVEKKFDSKVNVPTQPKPKRGRPRKATPIVVQDDSDASSLHRTIRNREFPSGISSKTISQEKPQSPAIESDFEDRSPESVPNFISNKLSPPVVQEQVESDVEPVEKPQSPTPPETLVVKSVAKANSPSTSNVVPPSKVMTEEERIIEENRRAKQAILAGLENDNYYSSDYYSESQEEEEVEVEQQSSESIEKSQGKPAFVTEDADEEDDTLSVSPYFSKSTDTTVTAKSPNQPPGPLSTAAKKFSRSVAAASKLDQKRKPGFVEDSPPLAFKPAKTTSMLSLAEKRALAGRKTKFDVIPAGEVTKDKFGHLSKANNTTSSKAAGATMNWSGPRSGVKRVPGMFEAIGSVGKSASGSKDGTKNPQDSDSDGSDTSIPAVRPGVSGLAKRGGGMGMLDGHKGKGRGRPKKSNA